jgi:hypothetical protein
MRAIIGSAPTELGGRGLGRAVALPKPPKCGVVGMLFKRALIGLAAGLLTGSLTVAIVQLYWDAAQSLQIADIGTIVAVGGLFGMPVGVIMALAASIVDYRSGLGVEWALVGALAALLVLAGLGHFASRQLFILLLLFTLTGALAECVTALVFKDVAYTTHITFETLMAYGVTAIVITIVYLGLMGLAISAVD